MPKPAIRPTPEPCARPANDISGTSIALFTRALPRARVLSADEEASLTREYASTKSPTARARLVAANQRIVYKQARYYAARNPGLDVMDLVQEGNLGLLEAISRFEPERHLKLCTYVTWWLRATMLRYVLDNFTIVKMGRGRLTHMGFFKGNLPPRDVWLEVTAKDTREDRDQPKKLKDLLVDHSAQPVDERLDASRRQAILEEVIEEFASGLEERDAHIFRSRMLNEEPATLAKTGGKLSISRERARQLHEKLKGRLRQHFEDSGAIDDLRDGE